MVSSHANFLLHIMQSCDTVNSMEGFFEVRT